MKKLLYLGIVLMFASCGSDELPSIKIGNLEVMTEDLGEMNWEEAVKACDDLGDGWRLPTKDELNLLYLNQEKIGPISYSSGLAKSYYWSSTLSSNQPGWIQNFNDGFQVTDSKYATYYVRAVRSIE